MRRSSQNKSLWESLFGRTRRTRRKRDEKLQRSSRVETLERREVLAGDSGQLLDDLVIYPDGYYDPDMGFKVAFENDSQYAYSSLTEFEFLAKALDPELLARSLGKLTAEASSFVVNTLASSLGKGEVEQRQVDVDVADGTIETSSGATGECQCEQPFLPNGKSAENPHPIINAQFTIPSPLPDYVEAQLTFGGVVGPAVYYDTTGLSGWDDIVVSLQADATRQTRTLGTMRRLG